MSECKQKFGFLSCFWGNGFFLSGKHPLVWLYLTETLGTNPSEAYMFVLYTILYKLYIYLCLFLHVFRDEKWNKCVASFSRSLFWTRRTRRGDWGGWTPAPPQLWPTNDGESRRKASAAKLKSKAQVKPVKSATRPTDAVIFIFFIFC